MDKFGKQGVKPMLLPMSRPELFPECGDRLEGGKRNW